MFDPKNQLDITEVKAPGAVTSNTNGTGVDIRDHEDSVCIILASAAGTGTSPTLDVKVQDSADNSTFADVSGLTFTQITSAAASYQKLTVKTRAVRRYIRLVYTVGGTSPSFILASSLVGVKQAMNY